LTHDISLHYIQGTDENHRVLQDFLRLPSIKAQSNRVKEIDLNDVRSAPLNRLAGLIRDAFPSQSMHGPPPLNTINV